MELLLNENVDPNLTRPFTTSSPFQLCPFSEIDGNKKDMSKIIWRLNNNNNNSSSNNNVDEWRAVHNLANFCIFCRGLQKSSRKKSSNEN